MSPRTSRARELSSSLARQLIAPADRPFVDLARALVKGGFLFSYHPERAYQAYGLSLAQLDVLVVLANAGDPGLTCSDIAGKTLITKGGITGILNRLEARGLVRRVPSRDDRRSVLVRLSAKGMEFFRKLYPEMARRNRASFERVFRPEQVKEFARLLDLLIRDLETR
jgi:MarR family transcriptional regulator, 2-MHQ and catechol-resistance regulon repressor